LALYYSNNVRDLAQRNVDWHKHTIYYILQKALGNSNPEVNAHQLREIRAEKEASISKRKKIDNDLRLLNQEITKKVNI
jgi:hypothetical protein